MSGHVLAEMDSTIRAIAEMPEGGDPSELIDRYESLRRDFHNGINFIVEAKGERWRSRRLAELAAEHGLDAESDDEATRTAAQTRLGLLLTAECIESPKVSADDLEAAAEVNEVEVSRLVAAVMIAQVQGAEEVAADLDEQFQSVSARIGRVLARRAADGAVSRG